MPKTFREFLEEEAIPNLKDSLGKLRHGMPQIVDFDAFKKDLEASGHTLSLETYVPDELTPTQKNFNQDKVDVLKKAGWDKHPIIISEDDYVIDGHHRWLAAHQLGELIKSLKVDLSAEDLLEFLSGKDYIEKKTINESLFSGPLYDTNPGVVRSWKFSDYSKIPN